VIKEIRLAAGWSLEQLASRLTNEGWNCAADQLAWVESQEEGIKDFVLLYFSAALGVSADELWKRAGAETVANSCDYLTGCRSTFATASESFGRADPAKTRDAFSSRMGAFSGN
jgi:transcriptional regulator with XRE-family HTH domain